MSGDARARTRGVANRLAGETGDDRQNPEATRGERC